MTDSVRVAVRIRPLNRREQQAGGVSVVTAAPPSITITEPAAAASANGASKTFTYDHVYWSADGFEEAGDGRLVAAPGAMPPYADQAQVFQDVGLPAVADALQGYNAAVFAYGQTGSGKTFSVIGSDANPGLVPRVCRALFEHIAAAQQDASTTTGDAVREYQVTVSMLEIYNERVRDLLARKGGAPMVGNALAQSAAFAAGTGFGRGRSGAAAAASAGSLKVRENATHGFYVEGLTQVAVSTAAEVAARVAVGTVARTTASTGMNETSSRSHMIVTLGLKQLYLNKQGQSTTVSSELHLVDLAGSERANTVGSSDRLREGAAINQSLSALGKVIAALAATDGAGSGSLAASRRNSSSLMAGIDTMRASATLAAATGSNGTSGLGVGAAGGRHIPYRSSALTKLLRNALGGNSRTVMLATISPSALCYEESRSTLRYADGAKRIRNHAVVNESPTDKLIRTLREENARLLRQLEQGGGAVGSDVVEDLRAGEAELGRRMADMEMTWSNRLAAARAEWQTELAGTDGLAAAAGVDAAVLASEPFLSNINPDPMLSHVLKHLLPEGATVVGRDTVGVGLLGSAASGVDNGEATPRASLVGLHHIYLAGPTIQVAHATLQRNGDSVTLTPGVDATVRVNGRPLAAPHMLAHLDRVVFSPDHLFLFHAPGAHRHKTQDSHIDSLDYDFVQMEIASAQGLDDLLGPRSGSTLGPLSAEQRQLRQDLLHLSPMVTQANAISAELSRGVRLELLVRSGAAHALNDHTKAIMVQVTNTKTGFVWHWTKNKFINRCRIMQEIYDEAEQGNVRPLDDDPDQDPFWDPAEDLFLGSAYVYLQPLAYGLDVDEVTMPISNYRGVTVGQLHVKVALCDEAGKALAPVAEVHAPDDLLKQRVDILVRVIGASNVDWLADDASRGTYIKYRFYTDSKMRQTRTVHDTDTPRFEYSKQFTIRAVSNNFLNYLNTNALVLELWGTQGSGSVPFRRTMRQALPQGTPLKPNGSTGSESSGAGAETEADSSRARSRATDRSVSGEGRGAERVMDTVLQESAWLEERTRLLETISTLQQEVAFLSIEKGALEKEVSCITLRSPSAMIGEQPSHAVSDSVDRFLRSDAGIRTRYELAWKSEGNMDAAEVRSLRSLCENQRQEAESIAAMLAAMCGQLDSAVSSLAQRVKSTPAPKRSVNRLTPKGGRQ